MDRIDRIKKDGCVFRGEERLLVPTDFIVARGIERFSDSLRSSASIVRIVSNGVDLDDVK
jgi:hypothetical protein